MCVCMFVCQSTHVCMYPHMFVCACEGLKLIPGVVLDCSSALFSEAISLSQIPNSLLWQVSLPSQGFSDFISLGCTHRWAALPSWHF